MICFILGQACRSAPADAKGCHSWSYIPQNNTCFLLNNHCNDEDKKFEEGVVSGKRKCAPSPTVFSIDLFPYSSAIVVVEWEKEEYCPTQNVTVRRDNPVYVPYYDFCGSYNIAAEVSSGLDLNCSVNSNLHPIPNWLIAGDGKGCTIDREI